MRKKGISPRLIDIAIVDKELDLFFRSVGRQGCDPVLGKHKSRFYRQQKGMANPDFVPTKSETLSLGKKLEILLLYGRYGLVRPSSK